MSARCLLALILTSRALEDAVRLASVYRPLAVAFAIGAALALESPAASDLRPICKAFGGHSLLEELLS